VAEEPVRTCWWRDDDKQRRRSGLDGGRRVRSGGAGPDLPVAGRVSSQFISIVCSSKQDLELVTQFDSNNNFRTHPNNIIELEANSFPS
jgi:hypothetical protein